MAHACVETPVGTLTLFADEGAIVAVEWGRAPRPAPTLLLKEAAAQLAAYFAGRLTDFDLPLRPAGTRFEQAAWSRLRKIPYGKTRTYGELADALRSSPRAVGTACAANPIPIVIPCHRVIGARGELTGYSGGEGVQTKVFLLRLEGAGFLV
jgi:methylated-DNA-[protein]-cysteine S-methyltransferase